MRELPESRDSDLERREQMETRELQVAETGGKLGNFGSSNIQKSFNSLMLVEFQPSLSYSTWGIKNLLGCLKQI